jgi:peptidoglycan/LPS O-acetylase OafA/YrhL
MNPYLFSLISLLLACLAALGSWTFVEGPALRLKRRISPSAHQPAPDQVIESAPPVSWTEEEKLPAAADRR